MDPWDRPYLYVQTVNGPKVLSLGKDGAPGGCGADADHERFIDEPGRNVPTRSQRGEERSWVFKLDVPPRQACR